jgi:hypothetical protein
MVASAVHPPNKKYALGTLLSSKIGQTNATKKLQTPIEYCQALATVRKGILADRSSRKETYRMLDS